MNTINRNMDIFNELTEYINIRMKSYRRLDHEINWREHKSHIDYDLWFVLAGDVDITINGTTHTAVPGDVILYKPHLPYIASAYRCNCQFIYVHFDFEIGDQKKILDAFQVFGIIPSTFIQKEALLFRQALEQSEQPNLPNNCLYLKACLTLVISKIIEISARDHQITTFPIESSSQKSKKSLETMRPVLQYIDNNLQESIKIQTLAELSGMSEKYFIVYFKEVLGISPGQYIYQIKMNRAREYLYGKKYSIQQISSFLGYSSPFSFTKAFKKYYHIPPSKFI
ncbi:MAG: AraC family transcriptional regulator [Anaerocolumna sp.]